MLNHTHPPRKGPHADIGGWMCHHPRQEQVIEQLYIPARLAQKLWIKASDVSSNCIVNGSFFQGVGEIYKSFFTNHQPFNLVTPQKCRCWLGWSTLQGFAYQGSPVNVSLAKKGWDFCPWNLETEMLRCYICTPRNTMWGTDYSSLFLSDMNVYIMRG